MANTKRVLSRDDLLGATARPRDEVEIPELGGVVYVQGLTSGERDKYEGEIMKRDRRSGQMIPQLTKVRALLIALSVTDAEGTPLFSENDLHEIGRIPARTIQKMFDKAAELSGLSETDVEDLERDFEKAQRDGSSSDSQGTSDGRSQSSGKSFQAVS